jgi:hypothetical protein
MTKVFFSNFLKSASHQSCPCWESVIGSQTMLSCRPFGRRGAVKLSNAKLIAILFSTFFQWDENLRSKTQRRTRITTDSMNTLNSLIREIRVHRFTPVRLAVSTSDIRGYPCPSVVKIISSRLQHCPPRAFG